MTQPDAHDPAPQTRNALRRQSIAAFRRALGLTALGTILPGAGLTQTRSRKAGWTLLAITILGIAAAAYYVFTTGVTNVALSLLARPSALQALTIGSIAGGLLWCGSIILTAVRSRPARLDRTRTVILAGFTTLMVSAVAAGCFKVAEYAAMTQSTITTVFDTTPDLPVLPGHGTPAAENEDPWAGQSRVNILLLGSDAGVGRTGTRTDSMIVASIDTKTGRTALISLPRNLLRAPLPKNSPLRGLYPSGVYGAPSCYRLQRDPSHSDYCSLNAVWTEADQWHADHPGSYAGVRVPGRQEIRDVIQEIVGLRIDHIVVIDLKGFQQLVDAMGGIYIDVKPSGTGLPLPIEGHSDGHGGVVGETGFFKTGYQHLNGYYALWYARTRAADDDYFRQQRQRCVIKAIVNQVNPARMLGEYPRLLQIARDNIYTDIPAQSLPAFVDLIERVQKSTITSVALTAAQGIDSSDPDYARIRRLVDKGVTAPVPPKPSSPATSTTSTSSSSTSTHSATKPPSRTATTQPASECD
ncbi:LCP family protein [Monashia sp. NPDC004114]